MEIRVIHFQFVALILAFALLSLIGVPQHAFAQSTNKTPSAPLIVDGREAEELWIITNQGRFRFTAEIADDDAERSQGLMYRETMAPTHGMLFDFEDTRRVQMWMRNTPLSLDMVFINKNGRIAKVAERTTPFSDNIIDSGEPISFVLEINAGVSRLIGLKAGDMIEHRVFVKE